jgi:hypothetical protein
MAVYSRVLGLIMNPVCSNLRQPAQLSGGLKGGQTQLLQAQIVALPAMTCRIADGVESLGPDDAPMPMELNDGDVIDDSNFCQPVPTLMFTEYQNLTFRLCNLLNVQLDPACGHIVDDCLWIEKEFCSHLHPELVEKGLPECDENCRHRNGDKYHDITTGRHIGCAVEMDTTEIPDEDQIPMEVK